MPKLDSETMTIEEIHQEAVQESELPQTIKRFEEEVWLNGLAEMVKACEEESLVFEPFLPKSGFYHYDTSTSKSTRLGIHKAGERILFTFVAGKTDDNIRLCCLANETPSHMGLNKIYADDDLETVLKIMRSIIKAWQDPSKRKLSTCRAVRIVEVAQFGN